MSKSLNELIARCESAGGPDRELDAEIAAALQFQSTFPPPYTMSRYNQGVTITKLRARKDASDD